MHTQQIRYRSLTRGRKATQIREARRRLLRSVEKLQEAELALAGKGAVTCTFTVMVCPTEAK